MTTLYVQGFIVAPTQPDAGGVYGYDNSGFFGPQFSNLGGLPYTVVWTGTPCNCSVGPVIVNGDFTHINGPITGATITINGITVDLFQFNNVTQSEWLTAAPNAGAQVQTEILSEPFPSGAAILPSSEYSLTTWFNGNSTGGADGVFYLHDTQHNFTTNAFLTVDFVGENPMPVPAPVVGEGLIPLLLGVCLLMWGKRTVFNHLNVPAMTGCSQSANPQRMQ
jgi:hypothetical protein